MDLLHPQCAGLDIHPRTVVACARVVAGSSVTHDRRTFGTTTMPATRPAVQAAPTLRDSRGTALEEDAP